MFDIFFNTLTTNCHVKKGDAILVCCSGGIDSIVLLHLMQRASEILKLRLGVIHVDHGIRGDQSKKDAMFVQEGCQEMDVEFFLKELHLRHDNPNLEEVARLRRYEEIGKCMHEHSFDYAATGHNLDDQAETTLYRLIRGSGLRGLSGIQYERKDRIIRPLLDISRAQIEKYAKNNHIGFVEDLTNRDIQIPRNLIRHEIIPRMREINPSVIESIARFTRIAAKESAALDTIASDLSADAIKLDWNIIKVFDKTKLKTAEQAIVGRLIIKEISEMLDEPRGIDASQIDLAMEVIYGKMRSHDIKRRLRIITCRNDIVIHSISKEPFFNVEIQTPGIYHVPGIDQPLKIKYNNSFLDSVRIRSWISGDMINGKRVVKILSDKGIIMPLRAFWPVVLDKNQIIGIAGIYLKNSYDLIIEFPYAK
jgi:tRNA(Ile)-lysidine synthase